MVAYLPAHVDFGHILMPLSYSIFGRKVTGKLAIGIIDLPICCHSFAGAGLTKAEDECIALSHKKSIALISVSCDPSVPRVMLVLASPEPFD